MESELSDSQRRNADFAVGSVLSRKFGKGTKQKPEETRKFVDNAFCDGALKTMGTVIYKLMPHVSRFGGGGRAKNKQGVIEKLKALFEKYFGLGITEFRAEEPAPNRKTE